MPGFSVFDLLISLAIAAILTALAVPPFSQFIAGHRATATINTFAGAIALARSAAISHRKEVIFCPANGNRCGRRNSWQDGALVFNDANRNRKVDPEEQVYARLPAFSHGSVVWRSFRNRGYLRFRPYGLTDWQNGNFKYCPEDNDPRHARMLILNYAGRVRAAPDRDRNGVREGADGRDLTCA